MEVCKSCDHNVAIECNGGCFFPYATPPCFRQAMESQTTGLHQLKAEIPRLKLKAEIARLKKELDLGHIDYSCFVNLVCEL
jgi:hypothetical protein